MTVSEAPPDRLETVAGVRRRLLELVRPLGAEPVGLDAALGRVLAEDVRAQWDSPGFDNSAMDGYAVRAADVAAASEASPARLPLRDESRAGSRPGNHARGTAMRILTGAALPAGADAVVRQEDTSRDGDDVLIRVAVPAGTSVRRRGEDFAAGAAVLQPGERLTSADIAMAAASGSASLPVGRRPRVTVLATGDELVPAGLEPAGSLVPDSNTPMLVAAVHEAGGDPLSLGIIPDRRDALRTALQRAADSDLIVSSAGVSVGDHDHVRDVLAELGDIVAWRVAMRPGKPLLVGRVGDTPFIGLPGNPVSSSVTFELFARPAILKLQGARRLDRPRVRVRLAEAMRKPEGLETYARVRLVPADSDLPAALSHGGQGSHLLGALVAADALLVLPAPGDSVPAGAVLEAIPLR